MSIDIYYIFLAIFILSNAIITVNSVSVGEDSLLLPLSSFSHFCNNGYASIQNKLDILKNTRKTANSNSNDATMSTIPQQQYDVTRRQLEEEGRLERALKNWPSSQQQLEAQSSYENAIKKFKVIALLAPTLKESHCKLGLAYFVNGDHVNAKASTLKGLKIDSNDADLNVLMGQLLLLEKSNKKSCDYFEQVLKQNDRMDAHLGKAICSAKNGLSKVAIQHFEHVVEVTTTAATASTAVDSINKKKNNGNSINKNVLLKLSAYIGIGRVICENENFEKAHLYFNQALKVMPQSSKVQMAIGDCYYLHANILAQYSQQDDAGEGDRLKTKAISHYQQATWLDKESITSNLKLGNILMKEKRYKEAFNHLQKAVEISLSKDDSMSYNQGIHMLADIFSMQNNLKAAEAYYEKVLDNVVSNSNNNNKHEKEIMDIKEKLIDVKSKRGNFISASNLMRDIVKSRPMSAELHSKLARLLFFAGDVESAIESARHSIWLDDRCGECYGNLGLIEMYTRDSSLSNIVNNLILADDIIDKGEESSFFTIKSHLLKGVVYSKLKNWEKAAQTFQLCIDAGETIPATMANSGTDEIVNTNKFLKSLCLNNLAVVQIHMPGANSEETIKRAKDNFKNAHASMSSKCNILKHTIKKHLDSLTSDDSGKNNEVVGEAQHFLVDSELILWLCTQKVPTTTTTDGSMSLVLPLTLGKISAAVLNNIKGIAMKTDREDKVNQDNNDSWVGWVKGVVTSFVGEKKSPQVNMTKTHKQNDNNKMVGGMDIPDISSMMAPPMVTPGSISSKHMHMDISGNNGNVDTTATTIPEATMPKEKTNAELMGEYRSYVTNGQILENAGEWKSAVLAYEKAILLIKNNNNFYDVTAELLHSYGRTLHLTGDRKSAIEVFDQAIYLLDNNNNDKSSISFYGPEKSASLLADAGMAHDEENNVQRAANLYVAAIDTDPESQDAYYRLANLLIKDEQPNVAINFYYRLLKVQLQNGVENVTPRPFKLLVSLLHRTNRYEEAVIMFNALLDMGAKPGLELVRKYVQSLQRLERYGDSIEFIRKEMSKDPAHRDKYFDLLSSHIKEKAALDEARVQLKVSVTKSYDNEVVDADIVESAIAIAPEMQMQSVLIDSAITLIEHGSPQETNLKLAEQYLREAINASTTNNVQTVRGVIKLSDFIEKNSLFQLDLTQLEELIRFSEFILDNVASMGFYGDLPPAMALKPSSNVNVGEELFSVLQSRNYVRKCAWERIVRILAYVGNWEEADRQCTKWLNEMPADISALSAFAEIQLKGFDNLERSVEILNKVVSRYDMKLSNPKAASKESSLEFNMTEDGATIVRLAHQVGFKDFVNKNYNRSKEIFTLSHRISMKPEVQDNQLIILSSEFIAKNDLATGDLINAKSRLLKLEEEGLTWGGYRLLGDIYKQEADEGNTLLYKDAISCYRRAIKLSNGTVTDPDLYYVLGSSLLNNGQYNEAAESLRTSMSLQPNNSHVLNNLGVAYFHLNRRDEAQKLIERSVKLDDGCMSRFNLGTFLYESRQYEAATSHFRHALRLCRNENQNSESATMTELDVQVKLAHSLRKDPKKVHEALALYREVLKSLGLMGHSINGDGGDDAKAALIAHEMQTGNILSEIGDILLSLERYVEAIDVIYESMEIRSKNGDNSTRIKSRIDYGNSLLYAGRLKEARDQYEIVLKAAPTYATAFNNLGVIAYRSRKFKEAIYWFQKVLKYEPRHVEAKLALEQITPAGLKFQVPELEDGVNGLVHKIVRRL